MQLIDRVIPLDACTPAVGRPILAIVVHHTATTTLPFPRRGASWHYAIGRDGTVYRDVDEVNVAHHVGQCDRWRPPWVTRPPDGVGVSDVNWCTIGFEVVYAPQPPWDETPAREQEAALRQLVAELSARHGGLPVVGHGELSSDKWPTEPHGVDWAALGLGPRESDGRWLLSPPTEPPTEGGAVDVDAEIARLHAALDTANAVKAEFERKLSELEGHVYRREDRINRVGRRYWVYVPALPPGSVAALIAAGRGG